MEKQYYIKVTGSGSKEDILNALKALCKTIKSSSEAEMESAKWEDETLCTELYHDPDLELWTGDGLTGPKTYNL